MSSSCSFTPLIVELPQELGLIPVRFVVALECKIVVVGRTSTVLYLLRVVVEGCCMSKDMSNRYSS